MSTATTDTGSPKPTAPRRSMRNLVLDPGFQFKYAGLLVASALLVMALLGPLLTRYADDAAAQAGHALRESQANAELVQSTVLHSAGDNPELLATVRARLAEGRTQTEGELRRVEQTRRGVRVALAGAAVALALLLGGVGIVVTHKVVGPAFKMKRLLRKVGTGRLDVREALRKGDELQDLFDVFQSSVEALRKQREDELDAMDAAIDKLRAGGTTDESLTPLRELRARMKEALGAPPPSVAPPAP